MNVGTYKGAVVKSLPRAMIIRMSLNSTAFGHVSLAHAMTSSPSTLRTQSSATALAALGDMVMG